MNVKLTRDQFEKLIHLAYMGNWVVNGYRSEDPKEEYDEAAGVVYAHALEAGLESLIEFDETEGQYFPSAKLEEELADLIDRTCELHATALAAPARMDLRLHDPDLPTEFLCGLGGLLHAESGMAARDRHAELAKDFFALVFVDLHGGPYFRS